MCKVTEQLLWSYFTNNSVWYSIENFPTFTKYFDYIWNIYSTRSSCSSWYGQEEGRGLIFFTYVHISFLFLLMNIWEVISCAICFISIYYYEVPIHYLRPNHSPHKTIAEIYDIYIQSYIYLSYYNVSVQYKVKYSFKNNS